MNLSITKNIGNIKTLKPKIKCPVCHGSSKAVEAVTVAHLVNDEHRHSITEGQYHICMSPECQVIYFESLNGSIYNKNDIKVPVWFKADADPKYACYCSKITEDEVIKAVKEGASTVKEVCTITGAMSHCDCKHNNPLGICCHGAIQEIISY